MAAGRGPVRVPVMRVFAVVSAAVAVLVVPGVAPGAAPVYVDTAAAAGLAVGNVLSFGNPCVADLTGDGIDDLVIDRHNPVPWDVYEGRADGTFVPMPNAPARRVDTHDCASGDFDRDGDVDLYGTVGACVGSCARTDDLWIHGPSGWTLRDDLLGAPSYDRAREATVADLDGDGWLDVAVTSGGGGVSSYHNIYWNRGESDGVWQGFRRQPIAKATGAVNCVEAADVTGDGRLDLLICQSNTLLLAAGPDFVPVSLGRGVAVDVVVTADGRWLVTRPTSFEIWAPDRTVLQSWPLVAGADAGLVDFDGDGTDEIVVVQGTAGHAPDDPAAHFVLENRSGVWTRVSIPQPAAGAGSHVVRVGNRALITNGGIDRTIPLWDRKGPRQLIARTDSAGAPPGPPTGLVATAGNTRALLSWTAPSGAVPVTDYVVQVNVVGTSTWTTFADGVGTATSATVTGLTNGTSYRFRVAARNGSLQGPYGSVSGTVVPSGVPSAPTAVVAVAGTQQAQLSWTAPLSGAPFTDYVVQYTVAGTGIWSTFADGVGTATSATVTGLGSGTWYRFRVAARNSTGRGPFSPVSNTVKAT